MTHHQEKLHAGEIKAKVVKGSENLAHIRWKVYIVFAVWCAIEAILCYFILVETKGRTLEELDEIFATKNPRKASTAKRLVLMDEDANIVDVKEAN